MRTLSVSQVSVFEPTQGGCPRRWWFRYVQKLPDPQTSAQEDGIAGHALLATYLETGAKPQGRVKMGTAATRVIESGILPAPGPDLMVERRFDDSRGMTDEEGQWRMLDVTKTRLHAAGVPFDGAIDLMYRRDDLPTVEDHKFSSDIWSPWTKKASQLISTIQMPGYAMVALTHWPDATQFRLTHNYCSRDGKDTDKRTAIVSLDSVKERWSSVETTVGEMKTVETATSQEDVPFNRKACAAYMGCPYQTNCSAYREKKLNLSAEEMALFADLDSVAPPKPVEDTSFDFGANVSATPAPRLCVWCAGSISHKPNARCPGDTTPAPVAAVPSCTSCEKDPEITCIVHPKSAMPLAAAVIPPDAPANVSATPAPVAAVESSQTFVQWAEQTCMCNKDPQVTCVLHPRAGPPPYIAPPANPDYISTFTAAVIPPDAPANDAATPAPSKAKKYKKGQIAEAQPTVSLQQILDIAQPEFPAAADADKALENLRAFVGKPANPIPDSKIVFELGPQTLEVLRALVEALK